MGCPPEFSPQLHHLINLQELTNRLLGQILERLEHGRDANTLAEGQRVGMDAGEGDLPGHRDKGGAR